MKKYLLLFVVLLLCGCSEKTKCVCDDSSINIKLSVEIKHDDEKIIQYKEKHCESFSTVTEAIQQYEYYTTRQNAKEYSITRKDKMVCTLRDTKNYEKKYSSAIKELEEICTCHEY